LAIASLAIAGLAMNVGCGSSSSNTDSGAGGGTGAGGSGAGGKVDSGTDTQVVHNINYTFDTDLQGWVFSTYPDPNAFNLTGAYPVVDAGSGSGDAAAGDGGGTDGGGGGGTPPAPKLEWDGTLGSPNPGSAKLTVTFTACKQLVDAIFNFPLPKNETGHMLHGRLQVTSGTFSGGAQLHVVTGADFAYQSAPFTLAPNGTFAQATLDLTNPAGTVNPAQVVGIGIQIFTGDICPYPNSGEQTGLNLDTIVD
jgi:hypothetical protein